MFESGGSRHSEGGAIAPGRVLDAGTITGWVTALLDVDQAVDDAERIDRIRALEELKCAAEAAQAVLTADLDGSQRAAQAAAGIPAAQQGRGVAAQVALARRESPHRGQRHLGLAKVLVTELPHTMAAFRAGRISEWRATILARETACLPLADRMRVDAELAADPGAIEAMGDRELASAAARLAAKLDPASVAERRRRAEGERCVTIRPAPDTMTYLTALLPVTQGVAVYAALKQHADTARAGGDPRGRGQLMADALVERATGQASADAVPVRVNLLVDDDVLFGDSEEPAHLDGFGPIPADLARSVAGRSLAGELRTQLRRLYASPRTGELVAMDSRSRTFPSALGELIDLRDRTCRTPWCDAPIRHRDHVHPVVERGPTSADNGQGLCEACNHAKQAPGWKSRPRPGPRHLVETTTPTGHIHRSQAPAVPSSDYYWPLTIAC